MCRSPCYRRPGRVRCRLGRSLPMRSCPCLQHPRAAHSLRSHPCLQHPRLPALCARILAATSAGCPPSSGRLASNVAASWVAPAAASGLAFEVLLEPQPVRASEVSAKKDVALLIRIFEGIRILILTPWWHTKLRPQGYPFGARKSVSKADIQRQAVDDRPCCYGMTVLGIRSRLSAPGTFTCTPSPVADLEHQHNKPGILNAVDYAVVAHANTPERFGARHLLRSGRSGLSPRAVSRSMIRFCAVLSSPAICFPAGLDTSTR